MAELNDDQKREIVERLACFDTLTDIVAHFRTEHEITVTPKQVGAYDPTRSYYEGGDKWRDVFAARRKIYLEDVSAVPVSSQSYRLNLLQKGITAAERAKNWPLAAQLAKQAAEEMGGLLTNQRHVAIESNRAGDPRNMTPEDRKMALAELLHGALEIARARLPQGQVIEG